ncbi:MAG: type II secretion system protein GspG [Puniceicoccales bacterium]
MKKRPTTRAAFTLLEIIIVVGLIAALSAALISGIRNMDQVGKIEIQRQFVTSGLEAPLMGFRLATGDYPTTDLGLAALKVRPPNVSAWAGPYTDHSLKDSWGQPYNYRYPSAHGLTYPDLWSNGPNRQNENGKGDDIANWTEQ